MNDQSAIVAIPRVDPAADVARLGKEGIVIDARPGHVRISPYFYNVRDDHRAAIEALARD
jgi:selenocysteine lyase/cysteine desulfurase